RFHRHGMELFGTQRNPRQQGFAQVGEVPVWVSRRGDAIVHLYDLHLLPRYFFVCQDTQHLPGSMASTDRHDEAPACDDSITSLPGNDRGSLSGNRIGIGKNFNLHVFPPLLISMPPWGFASRREVQCSFPTRPAPRYSTRIHERASSVGSLIPNA